MTTETKKRLPTVDGSTHEFTVKEGVLSISIVDDHFDGGDWDWCTPEGYEVDYVEAGEKDDTYSWHESPKTLFFKPLPPPVTCDVAPLTHRMKF